MKYKIPYFQKLARRKQTEIHYFFLVNLRSAKFKFFYYGLIKQFDLTHSNNNLVGM